MRSFFSWWDWEVMMVANNHLFFIVLVWFLSFLIHITMSSIWVCDQSRSTDWPSCLGKTFTLDITDKLFNQICLYLPCLWAPLTSAILFYWAVSQLEQQICSKKLSSNHTGGMRKLRQCGLTGGQWWNYSKKKKASHTQICLSRCRLNKRHKCSRQWPAQQRTGSGKASETLSTETQHLLLAILAILPTDDGGLRCKRHHPQPHRCQWSSTEDMRGKVLSTTQHFIQQSDQNNLDERKAVWKVLDRTLTEAGLNDNLM